MKRARVQNGCVALDKRIKCWNFFWRENGRRRSKVIGSLRDYPTKGAAWKAAKPLRDTLENQMTVSGIAPMVKTFVEQYRAERMPARASTKRGYEAWIDNHIMPRWGDCPLSEVQARPVELWLQSLTLSPKETLIKLSAFHKQPS